MTEHAQWIEACRQWRNGRTSDAATLRATAHYLHASANWIEIRDFLLETGMTKPQILDWFSKQDFPDFREAVEEGWGW